MKNVKTIALVVNENDVTVYTESGDSKRIPSENVHSTDALLQAAQEINDQGYTYVNLLLEEAQTDYHMFGKNSDRVKFFTVAKSFLKDTYGSIPLEEKSPEVEPEKAPTTVKESKRKHRKSLFNILKSVVTAKELPKEETTTVAVVDKKTIIPAEPLKAQITHANETKSYKGLEQFMGRLAKIIHKRKHTAEDLLKFIQKADLPITDSGDILAYKRVNLVEKGVYVDCHSGKVKQSVGDYVFMSDSLVDPNRSKECSQGLHVARLQYLSGFSGNSTLYILVRPKDFIAVPHGDPNKVRVSGYKIIGVASNHAHTKLAQSKSLKGIKCAEKAISDFIAGNIPPTVRTVEITQARGEGLVYKDIKSEPVKTKTTPKKKKSAVIDQNVVEGKNTKKTLPTKDVTKSKLNQKQKMMAMIPPANAEQAKELLAWKKKQKKSWKRLGVADGHAKQIETLGK